MEKRAAVSNLFTDRANLGCNKSWLASFVQENKNIRIASHNDIKQGIFYQNNIFLNVLRAF
jgi:hypothetical protein